MKSDRLLKWLVIGINSLGLLGFIVWLMLSKERILYTQDGVVYMLPIVPFIFVYLFVFRTAPAEEDTDDVEE